MVIFVLGLPGSGKSYFASRLAKLINAEYVNSDMLRKEMFNQRTYSDVEKDSVYKKMLEKMQIAINQNTDIVLDATFHRKERRKLFIDKLKEDDFYFIEVWANESITIERLNKIRPDSEADYEVYKLIKKKWDPLEEQHLLLESTNKNIDSMLQSALQHLKWNDDKRTN